MKRSMLSLLLSVMVIISLPLSVFAATHFPMVIDQADLFNQTEEATLEEMAQALRTQIEMDVVILTVNSLEGQSAQPFADDYYDDHVYGYDADGSGILFLLAMEEREWYISTCGDAITSLSDYEIQQLAESAVWYFSDGDYAEGFQLYLTLLPEYLDAHTSNSSDARYDEAFDAYDSERDTRIYYEKESAPNLLLSLVIGIITAAIVVLVMRYSMNTKRQQRSASSYLTPGSFRLTRQQDMFLYSNVSKVRKQQNHSSGSSSVHRSSGGRSHGGGGGRF